MRKKPKDLSASEREEREHVEGVGVYESRGCAKEGTRPVGDGLRKTKGLSSVEKRFSFFLQQNKKKTKVRENMSRFQL